VPVAGRTGLLGEQGEFGSLVSHAAWPDRLSGAERGRHGSLQWTIPSARANSRFQLFVGDQLAFLEVDQEHASWLQAPLFLDQGWIDRQHADFARHDDAIVVRDVVAAGA